MPTGTSTSKPGARKPARKAAGARRPAATGRPRARRSSATWAPRLPVLEQRHLDLAGLALVCLGVFLVFPLWLGWQAGALGDALSGGLDDGLGQLRLAVPVAVLAVGALMVLAPMLPAIRPFRAGGVCLTLALLLLFGGAGEGGALGGGTHDAVASVAGGVGATVLAVFLLLAGILLLTGASLGAVLADTTQAVRTRAPRVPRPTAPRPVAAGPARRTRRATEPEPAPAPAHDPAPEVLAPPEGEPTVTRRPTDAVERFPDLFGDAPAPVFEPAGAPQPEPEPDPALDAEPEPEPDPEPARERPKTAPRPVEGEVIEGEQLDLLPRAQAADGEVAFVVPSPGVLKRSTPEQARPDTSSQEVTGARLVEALAHFNVQAQVVGTVAGPHITRYELRLAPGIKMSKVAQLKDDLAYALAAVDIRILAPIPGKQAVGVEVPNENRRIVHLGDVFDRAPRGASPLYVWLGKDVSGKAIGVDLAKTPHMLIAGTTGAGKSACVNGLLSSILLNATPTEARLVLIDPKQVELNHYEEVPHLLTPVITSPRQAANALQNLVREMEWRYGIMSMARTRSLPELNKHRVEHEQEPLPYILCVIDELADLMMVAPADVEDSIIRIAQKARAVGIHLVLATQSPRVDVITGMIKANVPSRIAFAVSSQTDSRVILDQNGAESLLGMGDMLFSLVGSSRLQRIQGAYVDEPQIARITEFWAAQGEPELREDLLEEVEAEGADGQRPGDELDPDEDPLLGEAARLVVEMGTASTSMLQRRMRLGYTRAGRLMDMLERRGVIGPHEGSKPRQVLFGEADLPRVLGSAQPEAAPVPDAPGTDDPSPDAQP
jgi:S-DNA-T family DNA segregation ATPase FtsK/SpoIIIE